MGFNILGVQLRRPSWRDLASAVLIAIFLWLVLMSSPLAANDAKTAGGHLVAILYGTCASCVDLRFSRGRRYVLAYLFGFVIVAAAYTLLAWFVF